MGGRGPWNDGHKVVRLRVQMTGHRTILVAAVAAAALGGLLGGGTAGASNNPCTTNWKEPGGGGFTVALNWTMGVPGPSDIACIDFPGTYTVSDSESAWDVGELRIGSTEGKQTLEVIAPCGDTAQLNVHDDVTIDGTGVLVLGASGCAGDARVR